MSTLTPLPSWDARVDTSGVIRSHALHLTKDSLVFYLDVLGRGGRSVFSILSRLHVLLGNCLPAWGALVNRLQLLSNSTEDTNRDLILKKLWNCEDLSMFLDLDSLKPIGRVCIKHDLNFKREVCRSVTYLNTPWYALIWRLSRSGKSNGCLS